MSDVKVGLPNGDCFTNNIKVPLPELGFIPRSGLKNVTLAVFQWTLRDQNYKISAIISIMFQTIKQLTVQELKQWQDESKDFTLMDVRNPDEFKYANINGTLIPMSEIPDRVSEFPKDKPVVVHCHHGSRSKKVIAWLQEQDSEYNLYNLEGGIHAWSEQIDTDVPMY